MMASSAWLVFYPRYLKEMPQKIGDLVVEIQHGEPNLELNGLFATREDALRQLRQYLTEQREHAIKDLESLSKPYTSPNGITYSCSEHQLEEWRNEVRHVLAITERGLQLCEEPEPSIYEKQGLDFI